MPQLVYNRKSNFKLTCLVHSQVHIFLLPTPHSSLSFSSQKRGGRWAWVQGCIPSRGELRKTPGHGPTVANRVPGVQGSPRGVSPSPVSRCSFVRKRNGEDEFGLFIGAKILVGRSLRINFSSNSIITLFCKCKPSSVSRLS